MKLIALVYQQMTDLLKAFEPKPLIEKDKIDNQGLYLIVESLDDFRGHVVRARIGIYVAYKTLKGRKVGTADKYLDDVITVLLNNNIDVSKVSLVSAEKSTLIYRIEITTDICAQATT